MDVIIYQARHNGAAFGIDHMMLPTADIAGRNFLDFTIRQQDICAIRQIRIMSIKLFERFL